VRLRKGDAFSFSEGEVLKKRVAEKLKEGAGTNASGRTVLEAMEKSDPKAAKKAVAARLGDELVDLSASCGPDDAPEPIMPDTEEGLGVCRHTTAHVMAQAVKSLFKDARLGIGPTIEHGFYYDIDTPEPLTPEDLEKIESRMREIVKANYPVEREELTKGQALKLFEAAGETYKTELISEIKEDTVTIYKQGDFTDLCKGPHLPSTGRIKAFKLIGIAGAYWRGDEKRKMLQRIYGTAFADRKALKEHLGRIEEAKRRDHRRLGRELDLFSINDEVGPGLVLWHPAGSAVRNIIEDFWKREHARHGYRLIHTPHIARLDMWKTSGHWDFYRENLFSPMDVEGQEYIAKPMNCPFHIQIYRGALRSYRDLPVRYAELGTVYRYERSGVLHGLLRVRGFTQDDAHIYLAPDELDLEIKKILEFTLYILRSFGFNEYEIYLSTRPDKYVGELNDWQRAEAALKTALEAEGLPYTVDPGEGVFYGPKIDIKIKDVLGRSWQCSTVQVDFNLPERFDITYRNEKGEAARPIMIHRALMGSLERFFGCLIEHYAGAFPLWLAPVQVAVLTVTERNDEYAGRVAERLRDMGFRAELDSRSETLNYKIREARLRRVPYMLITGDREVEEGRVSPRSREAGPLPAVTIEEFMERLESENRPGGGEAQ